MVLIWQCGSLRGAATGVQSAPFDRDDVVWYTLKGVKFRDCVGRICANIPAGAATLDNAQVVDILYSILRDRQDPALRWGLLLLTNIGITVANLLLVDVSSRLFASVYTLPMAAD